MARTLIGNIKGKDGRGITSIEKTGTTGPVDTYTITYTDSTTSTFTVNNSDNIALQRQIVPSAAVESSATASQAYAAGDYVVVNGILRNVKSAIARGDAISDSNSTATTVTRELATLGDSVSLRPGDTIAPNYLTVCGQLTGSGYNIEFMLAPPRPLVGVTSIAASGPITVKAEGKYLIGSGTNGVVPNGTYQCWLDADYIRVKVGLKSSVSDVANNVALVVVLNEGFKLTLA